MGALGDVARDFVEVELHHVSVGVGQHEGRPDAAGRADRAEQIGVVVALVGGLPWPRSAPGPLPNLAVFLADAGLVFKPDFNRRRLGQAAADRGICRARVGRAAIINELIMLFDGPQQREAERLAHEALAEKSRSCTGTWLKATA